MLTIVTPNLNSGKYIEENILSILKLNIPFEHIIVDGGSTDNSFDIIAKYPHIKLLHQKEKTGMYGAIHQGFLNAKGDFFAYVNADDRIIANGFEKMYEKINRNKYNFVYSDGYYFYIKDGLKKSSKGKKFGKFFLKHGCMPMIQPASIYAKEIYFEVGGFRFNKFKICGDLDLFLRIANLKNSSFSYISAKSVIFIKRGDSLGDKNNETYLKEILENNIPKPNFFVKILFFITKLF